MALGLRLPTWHGWGLLLPIAPLCAVGVLSIQAISDVQAGHWLAGETIKQLAFIMLGLGGMMGALLVGYHRIGRFSFLLFGVCMLLLLCVVFGRRFATPLVPLRNGAYRWIQIGPVQVQPSELMKIAYVLALAWYLRYRKNYRTLRGLVAPFALTLAPMALIKMQPDLGTVLLFLPVLFAMLFAAGAKTSHLGVIILAGVLAMPVFWFKIETYQRLRVTGVFLQSAWIREQLEEHPRLWNALKPTDEPENRWRAELREWETQTGYQLVHSKTAIGAGGILGQGYGRGAFVEYDRLLPEKQNDFIFALVAHQWGLIGSLALVFCYVVMVVIGMDVATLTKDPFGRLVAVGFATLLGVQTLTNICMTLGIGPVTGVTLPFVSAGGSSLVSTFLCVGLMMSVAQRRPIIIGRRPFEFDEEEERYGGNV
jgi:rod shape determining protein RodA